MTSLGLITVVVALLHATSARDLRSMPDVTIKAPANLRYEELVYILEARHGHAKEAPKQMTPCARAILGCCKGNVINSYCSELLQCGAHFFDDNPCEDKFILDALDAAKVFYGQFHKVSSQK